MQDPTPPLPSLSSLDLTQAVPFCLVLGAIALVPQWFPHLWEHSRRRVVLLAVLALPSLMWPSVHHHLSHVVEDWLAFVSLLAALYVVAGGLRLSGPFKGAPLYNTALLAFGTSIASLVGTTGASMALIRPLLHANQNRRHTGHLVVFFIVLVSNIGGLLLPIGDPPLFMGFVRGVPFFWTLHLWPMWLASSGFLLAIFFVIDRIMLAREHLPPTPAVTGTFRLEGVHNLLFFGAIVGVVASSPVVGLGVMGQTLVLSGIAAASYALTDKKLYRDNHLDAAPMVEVATVFAAIFVSLPAALATLTHFAPQFAAVDAEGLFWLTGSLSSLLDNAPCYLTFAGLAAVAEGGSPDHLDILTTTLRGRQKLAAISQGAVMMGAMTYIGNGPNLMVRSVAQQLGHRTPSFVGYMLYTVAILVPTLALMRWLTS